MHQTGVIFGTATATLEQMYVCEEPVLYCLLEETDYRRTPVRATGVLCASDMCSQKELVLEKKIGTEFRTVQFVVFTMSIQMVDQTNPVKTARTNFPPSHPLHSARFYVLLERHVFIW